MSLRGEGKEREGERGNEEEEGRGLYEEKENRDGGFEGHLV